MLILCTSIPALTLAVQWKGLPAISIRMIHHDDAGYRHECLQECKLNPQNLKDAYKNCQKKAGEFLKEFGKYTKKTCMGQANDK